MTGGFITNKTAELYSEIDIVFKEWLASIDPGDSKEEKILEWNVQLKKMVLDKGGELFESCSARDLTGIVKDDKIDNIASRYWIFVNQVKRKLGKGGAKN